MKNENYKMYGFVPYHLSGIQKGIQFGHAVARYVFNYSNSEQLKRWCQVDETMVLLDGGTTNDNGRGSMQTHFNTLYGLGVMDMTSFREPSLNNSLTSFCFLIPDRIWDKDKYPVTLDNETTKEIIENYELLIKHRKDLKAQVEAIGGLNGLKIREYLRVQRLASN